jgi:3-hydroxy acid dehydrogenase/malonic semialdehyde reductase
MRLDLLEHGIKVSSISPGMVETEFSEVRLKDKEAAKKVYDGLIPLTPDDIADTVDFILSRPDHVNINDIIIMPKAQANATYSIRKHV